MHLPSPNSSPLPPALQLHRTPTQDMESDAGTPTPTPAAPTPAPKRTPGFAGREDCWSADATATLIEAWGERYLDLNRGCLRQKHWQEVADAVNSGHSDGSARSRRTDVQCKNRIDTLKKKYKIEKARVSNPPSSAGGASAWPFFSRLDALLGPAYNLSTPPATAGVPRRHPSPPPFLALTSPVPVGRRSFTQKRPAATQTAAPAGRSFYAFAAAVAAMEAEEEEEEGREQEKGRRGGGGGGGAGVRLGEVARAIERFGEMYERVERSKQRQMAELERQRMQFAKDLECHRMQLFMETQLHIHRIKRSKRSPPTTAAADNYA